MCTNLKIIAQDGSVVVGRTMDLGLDLKSKILVVPRNYKFTSRTPGEEVPGFTWTSRYGFVGMNGLDQPAVSDGMNEQGLYCGSLYLPGFTQYQRVGPNDAAKALAPADVAGYILSNAATVAEAKELMQQVLVWAEVLPQIGFEFQLHYAVHDKTGACAIFEYINGQLQIHDNPLGVLTNAPPFEWHLTNLSNYVNLTPDNATGGKINGLEVKPLGEGSGMLGLPGDFTPPSRFVRAVALSQAAFPAPDAAAATQTTLHVINNFDLVVGVERPAGEQKNNCDYTQWTTISDLRGGYYYLRMHDNPGFGRLAMNGLDFSAQALKQIDPATIGWCSDIAA